MNKLLVIADDLTGALDTGVCFAAQGIRTCVLLPGASLPSGSPALSPSSEPNALPAPSALLPDAEACQVRVAVVESRHMKPEDAHRAVLEAIEANRPAGGGVLYKKTDSALRGNIGAELSAALEASNGGTIHFIPAFPRMNRISRNGILYVDGDTPVAESVFSADPFNPVRHSSILAVLAEQTDRPAYLAEAAATGYPAGIAVHDAVDDEQILALGQHLIRETGATLLAGCAGFAGALPRLIDFEHGAMPAEPQSGKLAVFCGSVNPISLEQCALAEREGAPRLHLQAGGRFRAFDELTEQLIAAAKGADMVVLDTGAEGLDSADEEELARSAVVAERLGKVIAAFLWRYPDATPVIVGGDTLMAFARHVGIRTILPIREIRPGVVLARYASGGAQKMLVAKSGGFGSRDLLKEIFMEMHQERNGQSGDQDASHEAARRGGAQS